MTNTYETIFICPGEIAQDKIEATVEKVKAVITRAQGKVTNTELWGRRRLSYAIGRYRDGFYVYLVFAAPPAVLADLEHHYRVTDTIIRGLTVKVDPRHLEKMKLAAARAAAASETAAAAGGTATAPAAAAPSPEAVAVAAKTEIPAPEKG